MLNRSRISRGSVARFAALAVAGLVLALSPAQGDPLKGSKSGVTIESTTPKLNEDAAKAQPKVVNLKRLCSWKEYPIEGFPKSGFCRWTDGAKIGSACTCSRQREHAKEEYAGAVIKAPAPGESVPVR
jgi:hypothetical protein